MSHRQVAELCLKILAFYWLLNAINSLAINSIVFVSTIDDEMQLSKFMFSSMVASMVLPVCISLFLFFISKPVSKYIAPANIDQNSVALNIQATDLHYILLSIFGFILITISIIPITKQFLTIFTEVSRTSVAKGSGLYF